MVAVKWIRIKNRVWVSQAGELTIWDDNNAEVVNTWWRDRVFSWGEDGITHGCRGNHYLPCDEGLWISARLGQNWSIYDPPVRGCGDV
jgi:hypothetical protein